MQKEDLQRILKWMAYIYLPIMLLAIMIFVLIQMNSKRIAEYNDAQHGEVATTTVVH
jgi:hypothetical protein